MTNQKYYYNDCAKHYLKDNKFIDDRYRLHTVHSKYSKANEISL